MMKLLYQHLRFLQKALRSILLILSALTLFFCRDISGYTSNYNADIWFYHFIIIERLSMLFLLLSIFKHTQKICWVASELLLFFLVQDIIDRTWFNVKEINVNDYITIGIIFLIAGIKIITKYKNKQNDNSRTNQKTI